MNPRPVVEPRFPVWELNKSCVVLVLTVPSNAPPGTSETKPVPDGTSPSVAVQIELNRDASVPATGWYLNGSGPPEGRTLGDTCGMTALLFEAVRDHFNQQMAKGERTDQPWCVVAVPVSKAVKARLISSEAAGSNRFVKQAREHLQLNSHTPLSMKHAAAIAGVSKQHFCRAFRQHTGLPYTKFVAQTRVTKAAELMQTTQKSVKEIAYEAGFGSIAQFNRQFKRWQGAAPTTWRASCTT